MNSRNRYFLSDVEWQPNLLYLRGEEAHHCVRVLREKKGNSIEIFDGKGVCAICEIEELSKQEVRARIIEQTKLKRSICEIILCQAIPKGGNMEWIIQKAVELGVSKVIPLFTENTVVKTEQVEKKMEKWQRTALEACKQCGQNILPEIEPIQRFSQVVKKEKQAEIELIAALHPESKPLPTMLETLPKTAKSVRVWIGPEGDFSSLEYEQAAAAGLHFISLGDLVLKVETAALLSLSVAKCRWQMSDVTD